MALLDSMTRNWHYLFTELADDRSKGWFLSGSPIPALLIIIFYYKFVVNIGPKFMQDRTPFQIDKLIQVYNLGQVLICGWLAYESFRLTFGPNGSYSWSCEPLDKSMSPFAIKISTLTWIYYMIKILDLFDTVFFVLRKKFNQISFLHLYHHIGVLVLGYIAVKYFPDGQGFILIPLNCLVHCFMYFYYFLTNYDPEYKKKIWWKKHLTKFQIIQFVILEIQMAKILLMPGCQYPLLPVLLFLPGNTYIILLFWRFYKKTYLTPKKEL